MKGQTLCLIIAGLNLINGALTKEVYQIITEDSAVLKSCYSTNCVIEQYVKFATSFTLKTCDLYHEQYSNTTSLLSYAYEKVILKLRSGNDRKIITVDLKNCDVKEVNLDIDIEKIRQIVLHDDKYYVIYYDTGVCKDFYCKAIYDSNGKIIKENGVVPLIDIYASSDVRVNAAEKGFLVNEYRLDGQVSLYFVPFGDFLNPNPQVLFSVPHSTWYGVSTLQNKLGFCAYVDDKTGSDNSKKIFCKLYDGEGKKKLMESKINIATENNVEFLRASNFENGLFATVNEWRPENYSLYTFVVPIDEHGKKGALGREGYEIDTKCEKEVDLSFMKYDEWNDVVINCFDPFKASDRTVTKICIGESCNHPMFDPTKTTNRSFYAPTNPTVPHPIYDPTNSTHNQLS